MGQIGTEFVQAKLLYQKFCTMTLKKEVKQTYV